MLLFGVKYRCQVPRKGFDGRSSLGVQARGAVQEVYGRQEFSKGAKHLFPICIWYIVVQQDYI